MQIDLFMSKEMRNLLIAVIYVFFTVNIKFPIVEQQLLMNMHKSIEKILLKLFSFYVYQKSLILLLQRGNVIADMRLARAFA